MKASEIYFAAASAALDALPPASLAIIRNRDELGRAWAQNGYPKPIPADLAAAIDALNADPLAKAAMHIRMLGNSAIEAEFNADLAKLKDAPQA